MLSDGGTWGETNCNSIISEYVLNIQENDVIIGIPRYTNEN